MRRFMPYLIAIVVLGFIVLVVVYANRRLPRQMDERITLREKDKVPYGFAVARKLSASLFPDAEVYADDNSPGSWDRISFDRSNQAVIIIGKTFNADEYELRQLMKFVEQGNYVFVIAQSFSPEAQDAFRFTSRQNTWSSLMGVQEDSLRVRLSAPPFASDSVFVYPGFKFESWFEPYDTSSAVVLGRNEVWPNFIRMDRGRGSFFIHSAPLAFSNYFILHKNNIRYFEQAMSVLPRHVRTIAWNEFYLATQGSNRNKTRQPDWLGVLLRFPAFRWGFGVLLFVALLWVLLNSRRRQNMIPAYARPRNESLDFVKTMGRLYYEKRDHLNLARKMAAYFLEHVRSRYKLATYNPGDEFIKELHFKSGHPVGDLNAIVSFINYVQDAHGVNEQQLVMFQNHLESFYQNT